ncbi:MAG: hypothetical protein Q9N32_08150 [Gammaproteobacteria bacterium]|nr:hypothetical protein [Gammaproteobacteria bacterium]
MATATSAKPSLVPAILALIVLIIFGYVLFMDLEPSKNRQHDVNPPIEIIDEPPPLTIITEPDPLLQKGARSRCILSASLR